MPVLSAADGMVSRLKPLLPNSSTYLLTSVSIRSVHGKKKALL
jgi:hypothetical protein